LVAAPLDEPPLDPASTPPDEPPLVDPASVPPELDPPLDDVEDPASVPPELDPPLDDVEDPASVPPELDPPLDDVEDPASDPPLELETPSPAPLSDCCVSPVTVGVVPLSSTSLPHPAVISARAARQEKMAWRRRCMAGSSARICRCHDNHTKSRDAQVPTDFLHGGWLFVQGPGREPAEDGPYASFPYMAK